MKSRAGYVSNSSSSSFLIPGVKDGANGLDFGNCFVPCMKLPEEIWKRIEKNHVDWDGKRLDLSSVSGEWWLTVLVSDCMDCYSAVAGAPGAVPYLEGHDEPYGYYDEDGERNYIVFKRHGEKFYVDAYDFLGRDGGLPDVVRLRDAANEILGSKSMNKTQKLEALRCLFSY